MPTLLKVPMISSWSWHPHHFQSSNDATMQKLIECPIDQSWSRVLLSTRGTATNLTLKQSLRRTRGFLFCEANDVPGIVVIRHHGIGSFYFFLSPEYFIATRSWINLGIP